MTNPTPDLHAPASCDCIHVEMVHAVTRAWTAEVPTLDALDASTGDAKSRFFEGLFADDGRLVRMAYEFFSRDRMTGARVDPRDHLRSAKRVRRAYEF